MRRKKKISKTERDVILHRYSGRASVLKKYPSREKLREELLRLSMIPWRASLAVGQFVLVFSLVAGLLYLILVGALGMFSSTTT